jgi:hypothetical protein
MTRRWRDLTREQQAETIVFSFGGLTVFLGVGLALGPGGIIALMGALIRWVSRSSTGTT